MHIGGFMLSDSNGRLIVHVGSVLTCVVRSAVWTTRMIFSEMCCAMRQVDQVLFATGRKPKSSGLGLEKAGVKLDDKGAIEVGLAHLSSFPATPHLLWSWTGCSVMSYPRVMGFGIIHFLSCFTGLPYVRLWVQVDKYSRSTSVPSIWAIGDVTNRKPLTPAARMEGSCFAMYLFGCARQHYQAQMRVPAFRLTLL
jgi:hypothetical protein